jgi:DNA-binding transcriptional ArsR family regulator
MKPMQVLRDPKAFQLLADETRRKILYLLRVKEMTVSQLAKELNLTPQALYHHINKLLKGEMVEVVREERIGHLIESYYRATAENFLLTHGKISSQTFRDRKLAEEQVTTVLNALKRLGFKLEFDEKKISQWIDLRAGLNRSCEAAGKKKFEIEDEIWNLDDLNFLTKMMATDFVGKLLMSDDEFARQQETRKKLRDLLLSLAKK